MPLSWLGAVEVPSGQPVYVICASGNRSEAGAGLVAAGTGTVPFT